MCDKEAKIAETSVEHNCNNYVNNNRNSNG